MAFDDGAARKLGSGESGGRSGFWVNRLIGDSDASGKIITIICIASENLYIFAS